MHSKKLDSMKKIIAICAMAVLVLSCSSKKEGNMIVQGQIKGLKKGTLYLQKMQDTILVSVDSLKLLGDDKFSLTHNVDTPEMFYLTFDGNTTDKRILFFGEKGTITINDNVDKFGFSPEISGSKNQDALKEFQKISRKFNDQNLDLIKLNFNAHKSKNQDSLDLLDKKFKSLVRRRVLFATNFALNNKDKEVAPYIALTELVNANIKLLDTVNISITPEVKASKYGKKLEKFILDIKKSEK